MDLETLRMDFTTKKPAETVRILGSIIEWTYAEKRLYEGSNTLISAGRKLLSSSLTRLPEHKGAAGKEMLEPLPDYTCSDVFSILVK